MRGKPDVLMGGIRVYATGDVMQLPPLGTDEQAAPQGMRRRRELATESRLFEGAGAVEVHRQIHLDHLHHLAHGGVVPLVHLERLRQAPDEILRSAHARAR